MLEKSLNDVETKLFFSLTDEMKEQEIDTVVQKIYQIFKEIQTY